MFIALGFWFVYDVIARFHDIPNTMLSFADGDDLDLSIFLD
jgi:hypothetical protein